MSDSDTLTINEPQTYVVAALAAVRLYNLLAQTAPTKDATEYRKQADWWANEARARCQRLGMKQLPITRGR